MMCNYNKGRLIYRFIRRPLLKKLSYFKLVYWVFFVLGVHHSIL